jgi:hypothetical protein
MDHYPFELKQEIDPPAPGVSAAAEPETGKKQPYRHGGHPEVRREGVLPRRTRSDRHWWIHAPR